MAHSHRSLAPAVPLVFDAPFQLSPLIDLVATFLWALSGALIAARRRYDIAGVIALALLSAVGGGLIRDGLFLQQGPPALVRTPIYLILVLTASLIVLVFGRYVPRIPFFVQVVQLVDALGLGGYSVVGTQLALAAGISPLGAVLVGTLNAVGGGVLRDLLTRREPEIFQPGQPVALAALAGCIGFYTLSQLLRLGETLAAWATMVLVFAIRAAAVRFNLRTRPVRGFDDQP